MSRIRLDSCKREIIYIYICEISISTSGIQRKGDGGSSQLNKQRLCFRRTSFVTWTSLDAGEIYFFLSLARANFVPFVTIILNTSLSFLPFSQTWKKMFRMDGIAQYTMMIDGIVFLLWNCILFYFPGDINPWRNKQNIVGWY